MWVVDKSNQAFKVDPDTYEIKLVVTGLINPYTYSEMTGQVLAADARAPVSTLRELAGMVPAGTTFALVVAVAGDVVVPPPPMPPAVRAVFEETAADRRSLALAELLESAIKPCPPVHGVFEAVASTPADRRGQVLFDGLPGALEQCRCEGVDFDTLLAIVWQMSGKTSVATRQLDLLLTSAREAEAVELSAAATVTDLVPLLEARGARPFRLVAK